MIRILIITSLFLQLSNCFGQRTQNLPPSASSIALGSCSNSFKDIRGVFANPAAISYSDQIQSLIYIGNRFRLNELKSISGALLIPVNSGNFALTLNRFGYNVYNESLIGLSYGRKLFSNLSIGASLQFENIQIEEYGNKSVMGFQIGSILDITKHTSLYLSIQNIHRPKLSNEDRFPAQFTLGLSFSPSDKLTLHTEIYKELDYKEDIRVGFEYMPNSYLILRLGAHTYPAQVGFGFGVRILKSIILEASSQYHTTLGFTPGIGLSYGIFGSK